jgi:hypothetical protein
MQVMICAYSDRISCRTAQIPTWGGTGGGASGNVPRKRRGLVEIIATTISMMNGMAISRVPRPTISRSPPTISRPPTKGAVASGNGIPSLVNRPTPWFS